MVYQKDDNGKVGVQFYGSGKLPTSEELESHLRKRADNWLTDRIMERITEHSEFEHLLGIVSGEEKAEDLMDRINARMVERAMNKAMKSLNVQNLETLREALRDRAFRKEASIALGSSAKSGSRKR